MSAQSKRRLLFIVPIQAPSWSPVLDSITRKACAAFRKSRESSYGYGGAHQCCCGALSSCVDYFLPDESITNSLCIHYVAHHRGEVPAEQLAIIAAFEWGESLPAEKELLGPRGMAEARRKMVEKSLGQAAMMKWIKWGLDIDSLVSLLGNVNSNERQNAQDLFDLLRFFSGRISVFWGTLKALKLEPAAWGSESLRLPDWDRRLWLAPMLELLRGAFDESKERRHLAIHFRCLRNHGEPPPQSLVELNDSATGELKDATSIAIQYFLED